MTGAGGWYCLVGRVEAVGDGDPVLLHAALFDKYPLGRLPTYQDFDQSAFVLPRDRLIEPLSEIRQEGLRGVDVPGDGGRLSRSCRPAASTWRFSCASRRRHADFLQCVEGVRFTSVRTRAHPRTPLNLRNREPHVSRAMLMCGDYRRPVLHPAKPVSSKTCQH